MPFNLLTKRDFIGQHTWDMYRINICSIIGGIEEVTCNPCVYPHTRWIYTHIHHEGILNKEALCSIVKETHLWFTFYSDGSNVQLREYFHVWMLQETLQSSKWAWWWWWSCQQVRSLSLWLCGPMLKPFNKSIPGMMNAHADTRGLSATFIEQYYTNKPTSWRRRHVHAAIQVTDSKLHYNRLLFCHYFLGGSIPTSLELRQNSSCWREVSMAVSWPGPARATPGTSPCLLG